MNEKVYVVVHRGSHQIGGCCTEITYKGTRIAIDFGSPLPGEYQSELDVPGATSGESSFDAVLFTHYHGDHIGEIGRINRDISIYMSGFAKDIIAAYKEHSERFYPEIEVERISEIQAGKELYVGSLKIIPILSDHSAAESFMFLIYAGDFKILHTGDFRLHGRYRNELLDNIKKLDKIDLLITEGTTLSRKEKDEDNYTEERVEKEIQECINSNKYCFFMLSSTNFERFQGITNSVEKYCRDNKPLGKYLLIDDFQKSLFEIAERRAPDRYRFKRKTTYGANLHGKMEELGFAMLLRVGSREHEKLFKEYLSRYPDNTCLIYSMWSGYMESGKTKDTTDLAREKNRLRIIHSSGHVTMQDLKSFVSLIEPKNIIVIHTDAPNLFSGFENQIYIEDGMAMEFEV